jgi:hypothetical protein
MALPWVRLDSNIGTHDKVLDLLSRPNGHKAFVFYIAAMGWCGGQGTDGVITLAAFTINHGSRKLADLLVDVRLWEHREAGAYAFPTWARRQESAMVREVRATLQSMGAKKANCIRWHGKDCGCWQRPESEAS